jgi:hypothetical protein
VQGIPDAKRPLSDARRNEYGPTNARWLGEAKGCSKKDRTIHCRNGVTAASLCCASSGCAQQMEARPLALFWLRRGTAKVERCLPAACRGGNGHVGARSDWLVAGVGVMARALPRSACSFGAAALGAMLPSRAAAVGRAQEHPAHGGAPRPVVGQGRTDQPWAWLVDLSCKVR